MAIYPDLPYRGALVMYIFLVMSRTINPGDKNYLSVKSGFCCKFTAQTISVYEVRSRRFPGFQL